MKLVCKNLGIEAGQLRAALFPIRASIAFNDNKVAETVGPDLFLEIF
jgi:hypothetical protein